jgi:hypothetical protein
MPAVGAMALLCTKVDTNLIRLISRWRSDEMLQYLHVQAEPVMRQFGSFTMHPGQDVPMFLKRSPPTLRSPQILSCPRLPMSPRKWLDTGLSPLTWFRIGAPSSVNIQLPPNHTLPVEEQHTVQRDASCLGNCSTSTHLIEVSRHGG